MNEITREVAQKVIDTVDAGLCKNVGRPTPGYMCVEAAVCYALGLRHSDDPGCVHYILRSLKISLNDGPWSTKKARAKGLRKLAVLQLGTNINFNDTDFMDKLIRFVKKSFNRSCVLWDFEGFINNNTQYGRGSKRKNDLFLTTVADGIADILIEMKVPGVQWLDLLENTENGTSEQDHEFDVDDQDCDSYTVNEEDE